MTVTGMALLYVIFVSALRMSIPMILATTGGTFSMRAGVTELGTEGMMIAGAFCSVLASDITGSRWIGLIFGILAGIAFSLIHCLLHVTYRVNPTISGMSVNLLAGALSPLLLQLIYNAKKLSVEVDAFKKVDLEWMRKIPVIGDILAEQNILFYMTIVIVAVSWIFIFRTKKGLRMRMVGENPVAANTVGINTVAYKYFGVMVSGALSGFAGTYLSLGQMNMYVDGMTGGRGYIAIVINAFGRYNPVGAVFGSLFFGFFDALQTVFQNAFLPSQVVMMLPYVLTLIFITFGLRNSHPPAGVGKHYND